MNNRPGLYREYPKDFFDLIVVDECHRGSADDDSNWHEILKYFEPAYQLGMTATPKREDNRDTYLYFGNPLYTYSLRQGIEDGFLAPYRVHRIVTSADSMGWRPNRGQTDRLGREIPDAEYTTKDFERKVSLLPRTEAIARNLTDFLKANGRFDKTIVFCVDQEHAEDMRHALNNLNADLVQQHPDYVVRVTADEGSTGRGHLDRFMELETTTPTIVTTSQLLTTGVDVQTCKNIVIARIINSMTEFKQIIGRGTRVKDDYGKLFFNILDYTGSATRLFSDPDFDGEPALVTVEEMNAAGEKVKTEVEKPEEPLPTDPLPPQILEPGGKSQGPSTQILCGPGLHRNRRPLRLRTRCRRQAASRRPLHRLHRRKSPRICSRPRPNFAQNGPMPSSAPKSSKPWKNAASRSKNSSPHQISRTPTPSTFSARLPIALRSAPAGSAPKSFARNKSAFFDSYSEKAREILNDIVDKYVDYGTAQFAIPEILKVPPISDRGSVMDISQMFGGAENLRSAVNELQTLLYTA